MRGVPNCTQNPLARRAAGGPSKAHELNSPDSSAPTGRRTEPATLLNKVIEFANESICVILASWTTADFGQIWKGLARIGPHSTNTWLMLVECGTRLAKIGRTFSNSAGQCIGIARTLHPR